MILDKNIFLIFLGGGIGAILRYFLNIVITPQLIDKTNLIFPYGTFIANIIGSLLIGFVFGIFQESIIQNKSLELFIIVGLLGGFTTFSTFSLETYKMIVSGEYITAFIYVLSSILIALLFTLLGIKISSIF